MKATPVVRVVSLCTGPSRAAARESRAVVSNTREFPADGLRKPHLTARELEVLSLLCEGLPNKLICRRLDICTGTVKCHVASILSTLGVASRLQAVLAAYRLGLVREPGASSGGHGDDASRELDSLSPDPLPRRRLIRSYSAAA